MNEELTIGSRVKHTEHGDGIVCRIGLETFTISFFNGGAEEIDRKSEDLEIVEVLEGANNMVTVDEVEDIFYAMIQRYTDATERVHLADKWKGGLLVLEPKDTDLSIKEIPIETFFHKIVMVRDRLRVLEQSINSHKVLDDQDKVNLQQYVTRIYGSLTTFNVLFRDKENHFKGEGKK
ncbi:MAG: hypothetical protein COA58_07435 [Bacteroidetes bacterium]|nr:MAG: hypothetical protein COA58_07435 [Bacteroidota bacterium]